MDQVFAVAAATVATGFAAQLTVSQVRRPRPHVAAWSVAMSMYALATWALAWGLIAGWGDGVFRVFYLFGAILNVVFLALGSAFLVLGRRVGAALLVAFSALGAGAAAATLGASFVPGARLDEVGLPAGSEVFAPLSEGLASPRLWAVIANSLGTLLLVALAAYSVARFWRSNRGLAVGNLLIIGGTLAPALGGSLTGLGEAGGLSVSLLIGAALLWSGYRRAVQSRSASAAP